MERESTRLGLRTAAWIGALALAMRLGHVALLASRSLLEGLFLDSRFHARTAAAIRAGEGAGDHPYLLSPLYPYFLALFPGVSGDLDTARLLGPRIVQAVLGAAVPPLVAWIATRCANRRAGILAGVAAALLGQLVHYDAGVLVASLQATFLTAALALLVRGGTLPPVQAARTAGAAGLSLGLAAALRPTALVLAGASGLVLGVALLRRTPGAGRTLLAFAGGLALVVLPFTARNAVVGGETFLLSANGGMNFWIGNHAGAPGIWKTPEDYDAYRDPLALRNVAEALGRRPGYREASTWWRDRALADVGASPGGWLELLGRKLLLFLHPAEIPQLGWGFAWYRERSPFLRLPLDATWLLVLALAAPFCLRRFGGGAPGALRWPLLFLGAYAATIVLFFVTGRYRAPILPVAVVLAAIALEAPITALRSPRRGAALATLVALALLGAGSRYALARALPISADTGLEELQRAITWAYTGRQVDAAAAFPALLERIDLDSGRAAYAESLRALGRPTEAAEQYRTIVERHPRNALAWKNLGTLLWEDFRRADQAEQAFRRALEAEPDLADARFDLGAVVLVQGRVDEAEGTLREALGRAEPGAPWRPEAERLLEEIARFRAEGGR